MEHQKIFHGMQGVTSSHVEHIFKSSITTCQKCFQVRGKYGHHGKIWMKAEAMIQK